MGMLNRRDLNVGLAASFASALCPVTGWAQSDIPFYGSLGPDLVLYDLDVAGASLRRRSDIGLPANLQYAWPIAAKRLLYVVASNSQPPSGPTGAAGGNRKHYALAFKVGADGTLSEHGPRRELPVRPIHCCTDIGGRYLLIAFNIPSMVHVYRLNSDGTIGNEVAQDPGLDFGVYAHQVRGTPSGQTVTLCSRGNNPRPGKAEDPGYIEVFGFKEGRLSNLQKLAPHGNGIGFGPRHLDFSPDGRFAFVSLERENALCVYGMTPDGRFSAEPLFFKTALAAPRTIHPGQGVGPIHVHPNGRFVYQTNRGSGTVEKNGRKVWNGGENSVAVWKIDPATGEPTRIQNADAHGFELRTFVIDPTGKLLVAASTTPLDVEEHGQVKTVSAGLSLYRIGDDGKLAFVRKHDVDTTDGIQFWCGLLTMG
jgi:6-phosphogluconolactonase (cycloisomerase 2 family)